MCFWGGGLTEKKAYLKVWLREEGLIREGGLMEWGLNRTFTVFIQGILKTLSSVKPFKTHSHYADVRRWTPSFRIFLINR